MRYTLWSRGRMIGETELGFRRIFENIRCGWFVPTAEGERLMPLIAGPVQAIQDDIQRRAESAGEREGAGRGELTPVSATAAATLFADMAESEQHQLACELELRREDGTVVPTDDIGLRDVEALLRLGRLEMSDEEVRSLEDDEDPFDELDAEFGDFEILAMDEMEVSLRDSGDGLADATGWSPEVPSDPANERFQIIVTLQSGDSIP